METKSGMLAQGFEIDGVRIKKFSLRPLTVRDSYEVSKDPKGENPIYRGAALMARRLTILNGQSVTTDQVLDLLDTDLARIQGVDKELEAALSAGFSGDEDPAPENPEAA